MQAAGHDTIDKVRRFAAAAALWRVKFAFVAKWPLMMKIRCENHHAAKPHIYRIYFAWAHDASGGVGSQQAPGLFLPAPISEDEPGVDEVSPRPAFSLNALTRIAAHAPVRQPSIYTR